jgi:hypothetical protein
VGRYGLVVEFVNQAATIYVQGLKDVEDLLDGDIPLESPKDYVQVFLARLEAIDDAVQKELTVLKATLKKPEIIAVQLDPETLALQMFQPAGPQVTVPVLLHPAPNGYLPQAVADLFTLDPFKNVHFLAAIQINAISFHDKSPLPCLRSVEVRRPYQLALPLLTLIGKPPKRHQFISYFTLPKRILQAGSQASRAILVNFVILRHFFC